MEPYDRPRDFAVPMLAAVVLLTACGERPRIVPPEPATTPSNETAGTAGSSAEARTPAAPIETTKPEAPEPARAADSAQPAKAPEASPSTAGPPKPKPELEPAEPQPPGPATEPPPPAAIDHHGDVRGLCNLRTQFPDDRACIPPPPAGEGLQIHVGPTNYDDPAEVARYILRPGEESSDCFPVLAPNDALVYFQTSMLSGRAGTHHIINTMFPAPAGGATPSACTEDGLSSPNKTGALPGASKPYMPRGTVAPEYAHVGNTIAPHAKIEAELHYFNATDRDILREYWLNIYFAKPEAITEQADGIAGLGGYAWNIVPIAPGTDKVYRYSCPVRGEGYILSLLGHYHAHGKRFTASITRATGMIEKVFEMYDYRDPAEFQYNSVVTNPTFSTVTPGAVSGRLAVHAGDVVNWECHIVNDSTVGLTYTNAVQTGEMCNLWGSTIGVEPIVCAQ